MLNQITLDQVIPMHDLSPLLTHPDFHQGAINAQEIFLSDYAPEPLTEDEMIYEVEIDLIRLAEQDKDMYLHWLGYAYGTINEGLAYGANSSSDSDLSALLTHPDFVQGTSLAQECFLEKYAPAPLTENEMVEEVEQSLSRAVRQRSEVVSNAISQMFGDPPPSYIHALGFVFGTINEGLTYTYTIS